MPDIRTPNNLVEPDGMEKGTECKKIRCPKCGDEFANLPAHLAACGGGDADA